MSRKSLIDIAEEVEPDEVTDNDQTIEEPEPAPAQEQVPETQPAPTPTPKEETSTQVKKRRVTEARRLQLQRAREAKKKKKEERKKNEVKEEYKSEIEKLREELNEMKLRQVKPTQSAPKPKTEPRQQLNTIKEENENDDKGLTPIMRRLMGL